MTEAERIAVQLSEAQKNVIVRAVALLDWMAGEGFVVDGDEAENVLFEAVEAFNIGHIASQTPSYTDAFKQAIRQAALEKQP